MQSFSFLISNLWELVIFNINSKPLHGTKRCANTKCCYISQTICEEMEISTECLVRRRINMSKENSEDVVLSLEQEVQREMFLSMAGIIK